MAERSARARELPAHPGPHFGYLWACGLGLKCMLQDGFNSILFNENAVPHFEIEKHPQAMTVVDALVSVLIEDR
jgi:hypothetical protein